MTTATAIRTDVLQSFNPATGELVGDVPITPGYEIAAIVARARSAQPSWGALSFEDRIKHLAPAGEKLQQRAEEFGELLTREMGKPLPEAIGEVTHCGTALAHKLTDVATALQPDEIEDENTRSIVYHDPFGVCAAISPWNFPLAMPQSLVIPALMAGNTVILKPSEETPLIAQAYVDILNESLSTDVLQIVHGADEQGKTLVASDIDLIAFTGSRETGKKILAAASGGLKRVILELGGKDPMIVLDDADVEKAADFAVRNSFRNAGQVCVATERIYVSEKIADRFEEAMIRKTAEQIVGDGMNEGVTVGPMISETQRNHVLQQIDDAVRAGARILVGGNGHHDNFVTPTVLTNLSHDMPIMRDETFGPVACIMTFDTDDEAIRLANDSPFGLGACVFGGNDQRAANVGRKLTAGMIGINKSCGAARGSPWVGARESGYGYHGGREGHRQFTQARVVSLSKQE